MPIFFFFEYLHQQLADFVVNFDAVKVNVGKCEAIKQLHSTKWLPQIFGLNNTSSQGKGLNKVYSQALQSSQCHRLISTVSLSYCTNWNTFEFQSILVYWATANCHISSGSENIQIGSFLMKYLEKKKMTHLAFFIYDVDLYLLMH